MSFWIFTPFYGKRRPTMIERGDMDSEIAGSLDLLVCKSITDEERSYHVAFLRERIFNLSNYADQQDAEVARLTERVRELERDLAIERDGSASLADAAAEATQRANHERAVADWLANEMCRNWYCKLGDETKCDEKYASCATCIRAYAERMVGEQKGGE